MALGGGLWTSQTQVLPGAYINFVSTASADASLSERGIATIALPFTWAPAGVFAVTSDQFRRYAQDIFGYTRDSAAGMMPYVREIFRHAILVYFYNANVGGAKASCTYGTAVNAGARGNDLSIVIEAAVSGGFTVYTMLDGIAVDSQTVTSATNLKDNSWIKWNTEATLTATAGTALEGGTNGTETAAGHTAYLTEIESYSFNVIGCMSSTPAIKALYVAFTKRLRDDSGKKFQLVIAYDADTATDYEGVIQCGNDGSYTVVPWLTGAEAGCKVNASLSNFTYDGEMEINVSLTQMQLEAAIKAGKLVFHRQGAEVRVLTDINSLVTYTEEKNSDFAKNQVVRVLDQIGNDIATIFNNRFYGKIQNNADGRLSLWNMIVSHHQQMETLGAIQNFDPASVTVDKGNEIADVVVADHVQPVAAMERLYMIVYVS